MHQGHLLLYNNICFYQILFRTHFIFITHNWLFLTVIYFIEMNTTQLNEPCLFGSSCTMKISRHLVISRKSSTIGPWEFISDHKIYSATAFFTKSSLNGATQNLSRTPQRPYLGLPRGSPNLQTLVRLSCHLWNW